MNNTNFNLVTGDNYTSELVKSFMEGLQQEKTYRSWKKRSDGLMEDCVGNVYSVDLEVTTDEVKVKLKQVQVVSF